MVNKSTLIILLSLTALPALARPGGDNPSGMMDECRQESNCGDQQRQRPKEHMTKMLSLRADQVEAVTAVLDASHEKRRSTQRSDREVHRSLHEQTLQQLTPLLDEEQMARFVSFTDGMRMAHQQRRGQQGEADSGNRYSGRPMQDSQADKP